jgi:lipopolysaccharide export system protein LptC
MQEDELESRQTRIVYLVMGLMATAGLTWALWMHTLPF